MRWSNSAPVTIADNRGDGWADSGTGVTEWSDGDGAQVLYASGVAGGDTTVTVRFSAPVTSAALYVQEYSGVAADNPVDQSAVDSGNGSHLTSRTISTDTDNELVFGAGASNDVATNPGNHYAVRVRDGGDITEDRVAEAGHYRASAWIDDDSDWVMHVVAFRAADASGPSSPSAPDTTAPSTPESSSSTPTSTAPTTSTPPSSSPSTTPSSPQSSTSSSTPPPTKSSTEPSSSPSSNAPGNSSCDLPDFPDASCTGVPPGTDLSAYTGPCLVTTANTVIDAKTINCSLEVRAANVVIKNSKVTGVVYLDTDKDGADGWSLTLQDSEVDAGGPQGCDAVTNQCHSQAAVCCGNLTVLRANVHGGQTAVQCDMDNGGSFCTVQDSWLHGQLDGAYMQHYPFHLGGFLSDGGHNIKLIHNNIVCDHKVEDLGLSTEAGCTGDVNLIPNFARIHDVLIQDNLMGANVDSAFCTYGGEVGGLNTTAYNVVYKDNVFERGPNGKCADYGPVTQFNVANPGNVWSGNVWTGGEAVQPSR